MAIIYTPLLATRFLEICKGRQEMMNGMWQRLICGRINQPATRTSRRSVIMGAAAAITGATMGESAFWLARQLWRSVPQGRRLFTYRGHSNTVNSVRWSPDNERIASGSDDHMVQVWNADDGTHLFTYRGHIQEVKSVDWSLDGKRIASGSWDNTVQVWNASD